MEQKKPRHMIGVWFLFALSIEQILNLQFQTIERRTALSSSLEVNLFLTQITLENKILCLADGLHLQSIPSIPLHVIGPKGAETNLQVSPRFTSAIVTRVRHGCNLLSHIARKARGTGQTPLLTDVTVCF